MRRKMMVLGIGLNVLAASCQHPPQKIETALIEQSSVSSPLLHLAVKAPKEVQIGSPYLLEIEATALENIADVEVTQELPWQVELESSEPPATVNERQLSWQFSSLLKGETKKIRLYLLPIADVEVITSVKGKAVKSE